MFTIEVNNLHKAAKSFEIEQLFAGFGLVEKVIAIEGSGPRFALVYMPRVEVARAAIRATNGHVMNLQPLQVEGYFV